MSWFNAHYYVKASSKFSWILTYEYEFIATFNTLFDVTSLSELLGWWGGGNVVKTKYIIILW